METTKDKKRLFSAISINRITAARFRKYSKKVASSHSQTLDDMMDFFEVTRISPRSPIFRYYLGLYNHIISRLDFIVTLLREHEEKYNKPTYNILARLFQEPEILETKTSFPKEKKVRKLTREEWELQDNRVSLAEYNSIKYARDQDRAEFSRVISQIVDNIEKVNPSFGKPYYKIKLNSSELENIKRKYR